MYIHINRRDVYYTQQTASVHGPVLVIIGRHHETFVRAMPRAVAAVAAVGVDAVGLGNAGLGVSATAAGNERLGHKRELDHRLDIDGHQEIVDHVDVVELIRRLLAILTDLHLKR